jgi:hypothetical protein
MHASDGLDTARRGICGEAEAERFARLIYWGEFHAAAHWVDAFGADAQALA